MSSQETIKRHVVMATGLDPESLGEASFERAIKLRMTDLGVSSVDLYASRVSSSRDELQALVNEVTVPETWFFRDGEPFKYLVQAVTDGDFSLADNEKLRVLSIPCSTGEEPYSIAMALLEAGIPSSKMQIDAVDINSKVLVRAKAGVYGVNSFRGVPQHLIERFFTEDGGRYKISPEIKACVNFSAGNVVSPEFASVRTPYHVVFCRNLLIYFNVDTKKRVLKTLHRLLLDKGLLFLGHAETGRIDASLFDAIKKPRAFVYRKHDELKAVVGAGQAFDVRSRERRQKYPPNPLKENSFTRKEMPLAIPQVMGLPEISELANRGDLNEARRHCQLYLKKHRDSSEGYYILALMQLAQGEDSECEVSLRKALYLDPNHYEALTHMASLLEGNGKQEQALKYRMRAQRIADRQE